MLAVVDVAESAGVSVEGSSQRVGITYHWEELKSTRLRYKT